MMDLIILFGPVSLCRHGALIKWVSPKFTTKAWHVIMGYEGIFSGVVTPVSTEASHVVLEAYPLCTPGQVR